MKKKRSKPNLIVGILVLALALVGCVSLVIAAMQSIDKTISDKNAEKYGKYEDFIAPVIMNDPDTFDDVTVADPGQLMSIAIWSVLDSNPKPDKYEYIDDGMLLPESEVEEKFISLFGSEVRINHTNVDGGGIDFRYSEKKKAYVIPITGITPIYTPKVTDAKEKTSSVELTVGYLYSGDWQQDSQGNMISPEPGKYMKITLGINSDGTYFVRAIQKISD
ncbi:MAG: hypothetical protein J6V06_04970 [Clostridia bacterium]|nr:hypothetical protein [Clostridia bacterium]